MKKYKELNLIDNTKLIKWLNIFSIALLVPLLLIFAYIDVLIQGMESLNSPSIIQQISMYHIIVLVILYFATIILHELVHGLFFKLFDRDGNVKFGFKNGLAYATSPNSLYSESKFFIIIIAPFITISLLLMLSLACSVVDSVIFVILAAFHGAACIGDFYWIYLILKEPKGIKVEDTEKGMSFYIKESRVEKVS